MRIPNIILDKRFIHILPGKDHDCLNIPTQFWRNLYYLQMKFRAYIFKNVRITSFLYIKKIWIRKKQIWRCLVGFKWHPKIHVCETNLGRSLLWQKINAEVIQTCENQKDEVFGICFLICSNFITHYQIMTYVNF